MGNNTCCWRIYHIPLDRVGLAANGSATDSTGRALIWGTGIGVATPLLISMYCMIREKFMCGLILASLVVPTVMAASMWFIAIVDG